MLTGPTPNQAPTLVTLTGPLLVESWRGATRGQEHSDRSADAPLHLAALAYPQLERLFAAASAHATHRVPARPTVSARYRTPG